MKVKVRKTESCKSEVHRESQVRDVKRIHILGDPIGAYVDGECMVQKELIERILSSKSVREIEKYVRHSIGDYLIILTQKNKLRAYSSPGGHAYFYVKKDGELIVSDLDGPLIGELGEVELNEDALIYRIFTKKGHHPLECLVRGVKRIPTGTLVKLTNTGKEVRRVYSGKEENNMYINKNSYNEFKQVLEGQAKVIAKEAERRGWLVRTMLSGGIDSTIATLALDEYGDVEACTGIPASYRADWGFSKSLNDSLAVAEIADLDLNICEFDHTTRRIDKSLDELESYSQLPPTHKRLAINGFYDTFEYRPKFVICGHRMDRVYSIKSVGSKSIPKSPWGVRNILEKSIFTEEFISAVCSSTVTGVGLLYDIFHYAGKLLGKEINNISNISLKKYVSSVLETDFETVKVKKNYNSSIKNELSKKHKKIVRNIYDSIGNISLDDKKCRPGKVQRTIRKLSLVVGSNSQNRYYLAQSICGGFPNLVFGFQGPMFEFFQYYPINISDVILGKKYYEKYFEDKTHKKYSNTISATTKKDCRNKDIPKMQRVQYKTSHDTYTKRHVNYTKNNYKKILSNIENERTSRILKSYKEGLMEKEIDSIEDPVKMTKEYNSLRYLSLTLKSIEDISNVKSKTSSSE